MDKNNFIQLIDALADEGGSFPNMPGEIFSVIGRIVPLIAVEIGLSRNTEREVLLTWRDDEVWHGWHLPGGYVGINESIEEACKRIALRELAVDLQFISLVDTFCWPDHPMGSVISLICHCELKTSPNDGLWYSTLPSPMVPHHATIASLFLDGTSQ